MLLFDVRQSQEPAGRIFKTAWFSKAARKAAIADEWLCMAVREVMLGQAVDLGGGVFKKRLNQNRHRAILLTRAGRHWIFEYLFAKKDRDNIGTDELAAFRRLVRHYQTVTDAQFAQLLKDGDLTEICHDETQPV